MYISGPLRSKIDFITWKKKEWMHSWDIFIHLEYFNKEEFASKENFSIKIHMLIDYQKFIH